MVHEAGASSTRSPSGFRVGGRVRPTAGERHVADALLHGGGGGFGLQLPGAAGEPQQIACHAERVWLVQQVDVQSGADLGNDVRAVAVKGLRMLWPEEELRPT
jgi:hypothetical protein